MLITLRVLAGLLGAWTIVSTLRSAVRMVVLPRAATSKLERGVFRAVAGMLRTAASRSKTREKGEERLAMIAPVGLVAMPAVWVLLLMLGYAGLYWAASGGSFGAALKLSGSSLLTLGFVPAEGWIETALSFTEATLGLGIVALLISYLPTMYAAFSRREAEVALLEVRAGSPPWAPVFLARYHRIGWVSDLDGVWAEWEAWFADIDESHTSLAALPLFRSPTSDRSWVTAAGTVLDAAALQTSCVPDGRTPRAQLALRAGYVALRRICDLYGLPYPADPDPSDPIALSRDDFDEAWAALEEAEIDLVADKDQAWRDFAGWRVNYDAALLELARLVRAPEARWTSDRPPLDR